MFSSIESYQSDQDDTKKAQLSVDIGQQQPANPPGDSCLEQQCSILQPYSLF